MEEVNVQLVEAFHYENFYGEEKKKEFEGWMYGSGGSIWLISNPCNENFLFSLQKNFFFIEKKWRKVKKSPFW